MNAERVRGAAHARGSRAAGAILMLLAIVNGGLSCSETHEPLDWRESRRDDLDPALTTLISDTLITTGASYSLSFPVGGSSFLLTGRLERGGAVLESHAYLRWDLADLPAGTITGADLLLTLRELEQVDTLALGPFALWMYTVAESWTETELDSFLARGDFIAGSGNLDTSGGSDTSDVSLPELFEDRPDLLDLIADWRDSPETNFGVTLIPIEESGEGFLRLVSREGTVLGSSVTVATPALTIEIDTGSGDTTITREPIEDTYVLDVVSGAVDLADSLWLVSSGYVSRTWFAMDLAEWVRNDSGPPQGSVVHRANLRLAIDEDNPWRLSGDETMTLQLYEVSGSAPDVSAPDPDDAILVTQRIVAAGDTAVNLDVFAPIQRMLEGEDLWLLMSAATEAGVFRSVALFNEQAGRSPQFEIVYSRPITDRFPEDE